MAAPESRAILVDFKRQLKNSSFHTEASNEGLQYFLPEAELIRFWTTEKLNQFLAGIGLKFDEHHFQTLLWQGMKLVSTLIWIEYQNWSRFHSLYCSTNENLQLLWDTDLPCNDFLSQVGTKKLFDIGDHDRFQEFESCQHFFTPVQFREGEQISFAKKRMVPILEGGVPNKGEGAASVVTTVYIPESSLKTKDNHRRYLGEWLDDKRGSFLWSGVSQRQQLHKVACKRIRSTAHGQEMGKRELENLKLLSTRHITHLNLAQSIAAISMQDFKQIVLLFELAECDLDQFLLGQVNTPFDSGLPKLVDLCDQMYWIGDALLFLHESLCRHLGTDIEIKAFCHLDIKPANILMYKSEDRGKVGDHVGTWKLTDFGISGENDLKEISKRGHYTWTVNESLEFAGTFTAPEIFDKMDAGRSADIWSLGCVLFLVTLMGIESSAGIHRMYGENSLMGRSANNMSDAQTDYFYRKDLRSTEILKGILNPHVSKWLDTNINDPKKDVLAEPLFKLIKAMLTVDPNLRVKTTDFLRRFESLTKDLRSRQGPPAFMSVAKPLGPKTIWSR